MKPIAIFGREFSATHVEGVSQFFSELHKHEVSIAVFEPFLHFLKDSMVLSTENITSFTRDSFAPAEYEFLISVGGDGTMLDATTFVKDSGLPMLGVNTGRLGFLSSISLDQTSDALEQLIGDAYMIDRRSVLKLETECNVFGDNNFALNELTLHKKDTQSMIVIQAYVDGKFLNTYWADGLIIATPTGSTAYSLSCGGPIILPGSSNFIITPVAPHNLNVRPVLIDHNSIVTLRVESRSPQVLISLDSRSETIDSDTVITLSRNDFDINLIRLKNHSFLKTLRNKLHWGYDKRN
ncbi:MAG: NAD kinase [Salibacteraceae bacterium]